MVCQTRSMMQCNALSKNCEPKDVLHEGRKNAVSLYIPRAKLIVVQKHKSQQSRVTTQPLANGSKSQRITRDQSPGHTAGTAPGGFFDY